MSKRPIDSNFQSLNLYPVANSHSMCVEFEVTVLNIRLLVCFT